MNKHYTYIHYRKDTDKPFYIGKGNGNRAFTKHGRNKWWHRIVNKHGYEVDIVAEWNTADEAYSHEVILIQSFRALGFELVNANDGGKGGINPTAEVRARIGKKNSANLKGRPLSPTHLANRTAGQTGLKRSDETRARMRLVHGRPEARLHNSISNRKPKTRCSCYTCKCETTVNALARYHKDCK